MKTNDREKLFLGKLKDLLDQSAEILDSRTRERLERVRIRALRSDEGKAGHRQT